MAFDLHSQAREQARSDKAQGAKGAMGAGAGGCGWMRVGWRKELNRML